VRRLVKTYHQKHVDVHRPWTAAAEANRLAIGLGTLIVRANGQSATFGSLLVSDVTARDVDAWMEAPHRSTTQALPVRRSDGLQISLARITYEPSRCR
jgi:hypothetical protein